MNRDFRVNKGTLSLYSTELAKLIKCASQRRIFFYLMISSPLSLFVGRVTNVRKTLVFVFWLLQAQLTPTYSNSDVQRIQYGTVYKYDSDVIVSVDRWSHTFEVRRPHRVPWKPIEDCRYSSDLNCSPDTKISPEINTMRKTIHNELEQTLLLIDELIPTKGQGKRKRSLFPFISDVGRTLFGIASESQIHTLARHINLLAKGMSESSQAFSKETNQMGSFVSLVNTRFDRVMRFMNATDNITRDIISAMQNSTIKHAKLEELS